MYYASRRTPGKRNHPGNETTPEPGGRRLSPEEAIPEEDRPRVPSARGIVPLDPNGGDGDDDDGDDDEDGGDEDVHHFRQQQQQQ